MGSTDVCPQPPGSSPWHQRPPAGLPPSLPGLQRLQWQSGGAEVPRPTCVYSCSPEHRCGALMGHILDLTPLGHSKVCPAVTITTALPVLSACSVPGTTLRISWDPHLPSLWAASPAGLCPRPQGPLANAVQAPRRGSDPSRRFGLLILGTLPLCKQAGSPNQ